jgi:hypothetical protein
MWFLDQRHAPHCAFLELNEPSHEIPDRNGKRLAVQIANRDSDAHQDSNSPP